ncbi:secretoglobin family 1D member-like isoform X1 [Diceros bicornis minor]|uniref:secretoglobin family 1D member-like isoform X1 n=1 Tax=Diceros bicornis minor TaxID=77932 RepID=UPI0026EC2AF8|nr:secretoglobin family 1D member-like isoform X1 [Diceros bicornis minor]
MSQSLERSHLSPRCTQGLSANAVVCPSLAIDLSGFLFTIDSVYKLQLQKYVAPQEVVEAKLQVKQCTNEISFGNRVLITETLGKILFKCGYNDLSNLLS